MPSDFPIDLILNPLDGTPDEFRGGVVAIGNFDGVHQGHQQVLKVAEQAAQERHVPLLAMTFDPHPRTLFQPEKPVFRITGARERAVLLSICGAQRVLQIPFNRTFSNLSATAFVEDILIKRLGVATVVIGYDFHFGRGRSGSPEFLKQKGAQAGFDVLVIEAHGDETGSVYSSSAIRASLTNGDIVTANEALGYRWFVTAPVQHGQKLGRTLGFPTANQSLDPACGLKHGIYSVQMAVDGALIDGVASFGRRPTFDDGAPLLETYLLDHSIDLYGKVVSVIFEAFQRGEEKFNSVEALVEQMNRDKAKASQVLRAAPAPTGLSKAVTDRLVVESQSHG